jgi:hypothetical protein
VSHDAKVNSAFAFDNVRQPLYLGQQFLSVSFDSAIRQKALHLLHSHRAEAASEFGWQFLRVSSALREQRDKLNFTLGPTAAAQVRNPHARDFD